MTVKKSFTSHLKVDKKIVSLLSRSTYQKSFSSAIRELVSNAYDADALSVKITFDENFSFIEIEDDGNGMSKEEFEKYLTIAGTKQDKQGDRSRKYKRKKIGQFGVGFLSIFPFCESLEITTTVENSFDVLNATIPTQSFFNNKDKDEILVDDVPIEGTIVPNQSAKLQHYTKIRLVKPTFSVSQSFKEPDPKRKASIYSWEPVRRFIWELQEDLPINLDSEKSKYYEGYKYKEPIGITVTVNGQSLYRNDYADYILEEGTEEFGNIEYRYIFTTIYDSIKPQEARGIKIRVNNVGIGPRTDFFIRRDRGFSRLHWITGEVFFSEDIKPHLNIGRDGFISNPVTDAIFDSLADRLKEAARIVEDVAIAEKKISEVSLTGKTDASRSKNEIIEQNIRKLESRGYKIIERDNKATDQPDIIVNKTSKTIFVNKSEVDKDELIEVGGRKYKIIYDAWDTNGIEPAGKKKSRDVIVLNKNYPLFKSKSHGNIFKRIHIILISMADDALSSKDYYQRINQEILNQFK